MATWTRFGVCVGLLAIASPRVASAQEQPDRRDADVAALREEVRALRAEMEEREKGEKPRAPEPPPYPRGYDWFWPWILAPEGISFSGYAQAQYESHDDSDDQLFQGGAPMNKNRFSVRRARVSATGEWEYAALALELDANTTSGPQVDLRKAEASLQYRPDRTKVPVMMGTVGLFDTPFGYELVELPRLRPFMERTNLSRAFWPGEPDVGMRVSGGLGWWRWTISAVNGQPIGTPYAEQNPHEAMDVIFRFGVDLPVAKSFLFRGDDLQFAGEVSSLRGKGFHPGSDATKATIQWTDVNGDGAVQLSEIQGVPGRAATPSENFDRWAVGVGGRVHYKSPIGVTKVYGEFVIAENMDRALFVADPVVAGHVDFREMGWYLAATQQLSKWWLVGLRYDTYNPNSDAFDKTAGAKYVPLKQNVTTVSPLAGFVLPDRALLVFQYDVNRNYFGRDSVGVPTNLKMNGWTLRLQVQL